MKKILLYMFLLCFSFCFSQNKPDSLLALLKTDKADTNKVNHLNRISWIYNLSSEPDKGLDYGREGLALAKKLNYKKGIGDACNSIGMYYQYQGNYAEGLKNHLLALKVRREIGDKKGLAASYNNLGLVYQGQGNYPEALKNYFNALKINTAIGNKKWIAHNYNNIGLVYANQDNYPAALKNHFAGLKIYSEIKDMRGLSSVYNNLGNIYVRMGNYDEGLKNYFASLKIKQEINEVHSMADSYNNIGAVYSEQGNLTKAREYYLTALKLTEELDYKDETASALINLGLLALKLDQRKDAGMYLNKALQLSKETGNKESLRETYAALTVLDSVTQNFRSAFADYRNYILYRDSLDNEETQRKTLQSSMQYEFDKKEIAAKAVQEKKDALAAEQFNVKELQLSRSRYITLALMAVLLLSLATAFIFIRQNKLRSAQKAIQLEQKLLRSQMNPHFIFNSLQAIQNYILKHEEKEAVKYLSAFANIIRSVLENSRMEEISLKKEISLLENYLHLQKLRFGTRFEYAIHIDQEIDTENTFLPPMLSQPFIENALEHGMRDLESGGKIDIFFTIQDGYLLFEVVDNGKGIPPAGASPVQHGSLALAITSERLALINRKSTKKAFFNIEDAFPSEIERKGVKVQFSIPL